MISRDATLSTMTTTTTVRQTTRLAFLIGPILLLSSCGEPVESTPAPVTTPATAVSLYAVVPGPFAHYFNVSGNVHTDRNAQVFPKTQGLVERVVAQEGDRVRAGQTILRIDNDALAKNRTELAARLGRADQGQAEGRGRHSTSHSAQRIRARGRGLGRKTQRSGRAAALTGEEMNR